MDEESPVDREQRERETEAAGSSWVWIMRGAMYRRPATKGFSLRAGLLRLRSRLSSMSIRGFHSLPSLSTWINVLYGQGGGGGGLG